MSTQLFIGGPWDGKKVEIKDDQDNIEIPVQDSPTFVASESKDFRPAAFFGKVELKKVRYKRMLFAGEKDTHSVFADASLTSDDVLRMLLYVYGKEVQT